MSVREKDFLYTWEEIEAYLLSYPYAWALSSRDGKWVVAYENAEDHTRAIVSDSMRKLFTIMMCEIPLTPLNGKLQ